MAISETVRGGKVIQVVRDDLASKWPGAKLHGPGARPSVDRGLTASAEGHDLQRGAMPVREGQHRGHSVILHRTKSSIKDDAMQEVGRRSRRPIAS